MAENYKKRKGGIVKIMERTTSASIEVFGENYKENGILEQTEMNILNYTAEELKKDPNYKKEEIVIYLTVNRETIKNRIRKRNREEEEDIDMTAIDKINKLYEKYIKKMENGNEKKVFRVNGEGTKEEVLKRCKDIIENEYMKKINKAMENIGIITPEK